MKAITVRDSNGVLICWGPQNGAYAPGVPAGAVMAVEDSYDAVKLEYAALVATKPVSQTLEQQVASLQLQVAALNVATGLPVLDGAQS